MPVASGRRDDASPREAWVFDVDGSIVDLITGTDLRPLVTDVFAALRSREIEIVVWSAGGAEYARRRAEMLGFAASVTAFHSKSRRDDAGFWRCDAIDQQHRAVVFVDDRPDELSSSRLVLPVRPYIASNRHDRGLEEVLRVALGPPAVS